MEVAPFEWRHIGSTYLYNMLQDFRHLLIIDLRQSPDCYIRGSFNFSDNTKIQELQAVLQELQCKSLQKEEKYKGLIKVRRFFLVDEGKVDLQDWKVKMLEQCLLNRKEEKYYALSDGFTKWEQTYSWMCLRNSKLQELEAGQAYDRYFLYPFANFPSEIISSRLYISNVYCSNSRKQLADLNIKVLIDFIDYQSGDEESIRLQAQELPVWKKEHFKVLQIPINKEIKVIIDFDIICAQIDQLMAEGRTLLYCKDGETIAPAFAIAYLMYKGKLNVTSASLKVCQAISRVEVNKWLYTQLLLYKPK